MITAFKADVLSLGNSELLNKYYISGPAFALDDNKYYALRQTVSDYFKVEYSLVFMVGSAKLSNTFTLLDCSLGRFLNMRRIRW